MGWICWRGEADYLLTARRAPPQGDPEDGDNHQALKASEGVGRVDDDRREKPSGVLRHALPMGNIDRRWCASFKSAYPGSSPRILFRKAEIARTL